MSKRILPVVVVLVCVYLDTIFFGRVHLFGVRPDAMLAAAVSFGVLTGARSGAALGFAGGLLSDIIAGVAVGLNAALYLLAGIAGGFFYKKFYADNVIVPAATALACAFAKDFFLGLVRLVEGARFSFGALLIGYTLPAALMSALLCILFHIILKPLIARQTRRHGG